MLGAAKKETGCKVYHSHRDRPLLEVDWGLSRSLFFTPSFFFVCLFFLFSTCPSTSNQRDQGTLLLENYIFVVSEGTSLHIIFPLFGKMGCPKTCQNWQESNKFNGTVCVCVFLYIQRTGKGRKEM
jgi:hypothetical protein